MKGTRIARFLCAALLAAPCARAVVLGTSANGRFFTLDGEARFLVQASYYGALTVEDSAALAADLDELAAAGFNSIRVFVYFRDEATLANVSALTAAGDVREPYLQRLRDVVAAADARGMVVDCSFRRDTGSTEWPADFPAHLRAVETLTSELLGARNVYFDLANERNIRDFRYVPLGEVGALAGAVRALDPTRLVTASGDPTSPADLADYIAIGRLDFLTPHLCRTPSCPSLTRGTVETYVGWMEGLGTRVPVHLQEPFRRGWNAFAPAEEDFLRDATGAKAAEAAGWCFHNGPQNGGRPFRSFSMGPGEGRLFDQLDPVERAVVARVVDDLGGTTLERRRLQAEFDEQVGHATGLQAGRVWSADPGRDAPGQLADGPLYRMLDPGHYEARFRLRIDDRTLDRDAVLDLAVLDLDASPPGALAVRTVERDDFVAATFGQDFVLPFVNFGFGHRLVLRAAWAGNAAVELDYIEIARMAGRPAPPARTCLAEAPVSPFAALLQGTLASPARLDALTGEGHLDAAAVETARTWDFRPASGRDTFVQMVPVDPAWSCSVGGACAGYSPARSTLLEAHDRPDQPERDTWAFLVDPAGRLLLRGMAFEEGRPGELRICFGADAVWTEFAQPGACVEPGDAWSSPIACNAGVTEGDACGSAAPAAGLRGSLSGRAVGRGTLTLPSGHVLDALLVEHLLDVQVQAPFGLCAIPVETVRQHFLEWLVPHLGPAVRLRGPESAPDLFWQQAEDALVSHGLLPPLAIAVAAERGDAVTVTWDPGADPRHVDEYVVRWGAAPGVPQDSSDARGDLLLRDQTSYTMTGLQAGTTYHVSVTSRSRYTDPVSGTTTTYESVALPDSLGADVDGDGLRETSYPPEIAVHTRRSGRSLLRAALTTLAAPPSSVLPLDAVRDLYLASFPVEADDPDATVLGDRQRPLVFYALTPDATLLAVKTPSGRVRLR